MAKIIITCLGGVVQEVHSDSTDIDVIVYDLDPPSYPTDAEMEEFHLVKKTVNGLDKRYYSIYPFDEDRPKR